MATINAKTEEISKGVFKILWEGMGDADNGDSQQVARVPDQTIQIEGTFGGATVVIQGSNDNVNWHTLKDPFGTALSFTAGALGQVLENSRYIRPTTSGGTGTDIDVTMIAYGT